MCSNKYLKFYLRLLIKFSFQLTHGQEDDPPLNEMKIIRITVLLLLLTV